MNSCYSHIEIVVACLVIKSFIRLIITFEGGGVTALRFDRNCFLILLELPIPIRTRNEDVKPLFV